MLRRLLYGALGLALLAGAAQAAGVLVDFNQLLYSIINTPGPNTKFPAVTIVDLNGNPTVASNAAGSGTANYPAGAVPTSNSSAIVANANAVATLAAAVGKTTYITGFTCNAGGATAALTVDLTVAGVVGGTLHNSFTFPVLPAAAYPFVEQFLPPLPSSAVNTAIVVTLAAGGAGNLSASCNAQGFQL